MEIKTNNRKTLHKWTWYLYLFINTIQIVGIGISWILFKPMGRIDNWYVSIIVCNLIAAIGGCFLYYTETKELFYIKLHVPKKCFQLYLASGFLFIFCLVFTSTFTICIPHIWTNNDYMLPFSILIGICAFISVIDVGVYKYGKFLAEKVMYKRWRGENENQKQEIKDNRDKGEIWTSREKGPDDSGIDTPTSNLIKHVDKEQKN